MTKTIIAIGRLGAAPLTLTMTTILPPSAEWLARNNATVVSA